MSSTSPGCVPRRGASASRPHSTGLIGAASWTRSAPSRIRHHADSAVAGLLLLAWLASRLGWRATALEPADGGLAGELRRAGDTIRVALAPDAALAVPASRDVTLETGTGRRLAFARGAGGLRIRERDPAGVERSWTLTGASRGEPGILGEGIRQALLRDAAFAPAAEAARRLTGPA